MYDQLGESYDDPTKNSFSGSSGGDGNPFAGMGGMNFGGMGGMNGMSQEDILRNIFSQNRPMKHKNVHYNLHISLKDLYNGASKKVTIAKPVGRGVTEKETVKVKIRRGLMTNSHITLKDTISYLPDVSPGSIIFNVLETNDSEFERVNNDLKIKVEVCLTESLCGWKQRVKHLDEREIVIEGKAGVGNGEVLVVEGEGMPVLGGRGFGRLFVEVKVKMPEVGRGREEVAEFLGEELIEEVRRGIWGVR